MTKAHLGRYAQARFVADAMAQGLTVFQPCADFPDIDCVLVNGRKTFRIQIKAARPGWDQRTKRSAGYFIHLERTRALCRKRQHYAAFAFDLLAVWLHNESNWVFIRERGIRQKKAIRVTPGHGKAALLNNWRIFS